MKTIGIILLLLLTTIAFSENKKDENSTTKQISGKITDRLTGENLAGVKIEFPETNTVAYTDLEGNFTINLSEKEMNSEMSISFISYEKTTIDVKKIVQENKQDIQLLPVTR